MQILKTIITIILLLFSFPLICTAQTDLGIGVVSIDFDSKTVIRFYKNPNAKNPTRTIEFFHDKSTNSWSIKNLEMQRQWLKPEALWLDYSAFNFRCKSKAKGWYEVIVNNENGKTFWIKNSEPTKFLSWESYLKNMFAVERLPKYKQTIKKSPSNTSPEIKYAGKDCFQVKSMKGEWIEIFTPDYCKDGYTDSKTKINSSWIRWKNGNALMIVYFTTS